MKILINSTFEKGLKPLLELSESNDVNCCEFEFFVDIKSGREQIDKNFDFIKKECEKEGWKLVKISWNSLNSSSKVSLVKNNLDVDLTKVYF